MANSITYKRHEALTQELLSYADMHAYLTRKLENLNGLGNEKIIVRNILSVLEQSAKLITTEYDVKDEAETQLNELLR